MNYVPPTLIVDLCLLTIDTDFKLRVLLIERANEPFKGRQALPGGYVAAGETTRSALKNKIATKAGIDIDSVKFIEQLYTFDSLGRDPRGDSVSVCWLGLSPVGELQKLIGETPRLVEIGQLSELPFDHEEIIQLAISRLRDKIWYSNILYAVLPETFTQEELFRSYKSLDPDTTVEELEAYARDVSLLKENRDGTFSFKISSLTYFKK